MLVLCFGRIVVVIWTAIVGRVRLDGCGRFRRALKHAAGLEVEKKHLGPLRMRDVLYRCAISGGMSL